MSMNESEAAPVSEPPASLLRQIAPPRRSLHPAAYALIAASAVFGGVSAVLLLSRPAPATAPTIVLQVPTTAAAPIVGAPNIPAPPGMSPGSEAAPTDPTAAKPGAPTTAAPGPGQPPAAAAKSASPGAPSTVDPSGFANQGAGGPGPGPQTPTSLTPLSTGEINGVVAQNQAIIRRRCWQPALDSRAGGGPSARVVAKILIGPSGNVEQASASGAEADYPALSSCIAGSVKAWKFPPSSSATPVNIPFVFAAQ